jgi:hypothetical protein
MVRGYGIQENQIKSTIVFRSEQLFILDVLTQNVCGASLERVLEGLSLYADGRHSSDTLISST